ncbi:hypothetical protein ACFL0P_03475, partial [Candidatus Omnitrophota bacterium]
MLNWQEKRWVKIVAVTVAVAFLTYDIAWATDFSPLAISDASTGPGLFSKVSAFISKTVFNRAQTQEEVQEETEISFRSQLVPRKKYGEQSGFLRLESVRNMIKRQNDEMRRRKQIEEERSKRKITDYSINKALYMNTIEKVMEEQLITEQVMKARGATMTGAAVGGEFNYVRYDDGMIVYLKDGLPNRIVDERIIDPLGNVTFKNSYNFKYNENRLMTEYEADIIDPQENVSHIKWHGATYTADSVHWASDETNANKLLTHYNMEVTDPLGNTTYVDWTAGVYDGKLLRDYHEETTDILGNVTYTDYTNIEYDSSKNMTKYHKETKEPLGYTTITDRLESSYDADDNLISYVETTSYLDVITTTVWEGSHNEYKQLTSYNSTTNYNNGNVVTVEWDALDAEGVALYDDLNRLIGFSQKVHTKNDGEYVIDILDETTQSNIQYDRYNRMIGYHEVATSNKDDLITTTIMLSPETVYDSYHRQIKYVLDTTVQDGEGLIDINRQTARSDIEHDGFGRIMGYQDTEVNNIDNITTVMTIEDIVYNLKGQQLSLKITSTIEGESIFKKLTELETSKEDFRVNLSDLTPQERWKLLKGETITIVIEGEEIIVTPVFKEMPITVHSEIVTVREDIVYNDVGQVVSYSETVTNEGLSAGMILEARTDFEETIDGIWELADQAFIDVENLQVALSEAETPEEKARLTIELGVAQENKDKLLDLALLTENIYNDAATLIEEIQNNASEDMINGLHAALFEDIYLLGDKIDGIIIDLETKLDVAGVEYDRLKILSEDAEEVADEIRDFADDFGDYDVIRLTQTDEQGRLAYQETEHYVVMNGEITLNSVEKITNTYDEEGRLIETRTDVYSIDEEAEDPSEREVLYSYNLMKYNYEGETLSSVSNENYNKDDILLSQDIIEYVYNDEDFVIEENRTIYEEVEKTQDDGDTIKELGLSYREATNFSYVDGIKVASTIARYVTSYEEDFDGNEELVGSEQRSYEYNDAGELIREEIYVYDGSGTILIAKEVINYEYDVDGNLINKTTVFSVIIDDIEHIVTTIEAASSYEGGVLLGKTEETTVYSDAAVEEITLIEEKYDQNGDLVKRITSADKYSAGTLQEREQTVEEYDSQARLVSQDIAKYETEAGELSATATERTVKTNFVYDAEHAQKLINYTVNIYSSDYLGQEELEKTGTVTRTQVYDLLKQEDLANKAEQKAGSELSFLGSGIERHKKLLSGIDSFLNSLPLQKDTVTVSLRKNTIYDKFARVISYEENTSNNGIAIEMIWSVVDTIDDMIDWIDSRIVSLEDKIALLNAYKEEAVESGKESYEERIINQISDAELLISEFKELLPLVHDAKVEIDVFYTFINEGSDGNVIKEAYQRIFHALTFFLEGVNEFTLSFEDLLWSAKEDKFYAEEESKKKGSNYAAANKLVEQLEKELVEAVKRRDEEPTEYNIAEVERLQEALLDAKEDTEILKDESDIAKENFEDAKKRVETLEMDFDVTFDIKKQADKAASILSSILDVETQTERKDMTYNSLGQMSGYTDITSQFGISQISAWNSLNTVVEINHGIKHEISFLSGRIEALGLELIEAQSGELQTKVDELQGSIDELVSQKEALEGLLPLIASSVEKTSIFYNLVASDAGAQLIEDAQLQALEAISALGYELDDVIWQTEDNYTLQQEKVKELNADLSRVNNHIYAYQEVYNKADKEAREAETNVANDPTEENIAKAEELREKADIAKIELEEVHAAEKVIRAEYEKENAILHIIEKAVVDVGKIGDNTQLSSSVFSLSSILDVETQLERKDMTYNSLGQMSGYTDITSQFGISQISAWNSLNTVVEINHGIKHEISFLSGRIEALGLELIEAQSGELQTKVDELQGSIDELVSQKEALEGLLPLIASSVEKTSIFYNLVASDAGAQLIEDAQLQALEAISALGYELDDVIWQTEDNYTLQQQDLDILKSVEVELNNALQIVEDFGRIAGRYEVEEKEYSGDLLVKKIIKEYEYTADDRESGESDSLLVAEKETAYTYNNKAELIEETTDYFRIIGESRRRILRDKVFYEYADGRVSFQKTESYDVLTYEQEVLRTIQEQFNEYNSGGQLIRETKDLYRVDSDGGLVFSEKSTSEFIYTSHDTTQIDKTFSATGELVKQKIIIKNYDNGALTDEVTQYYLVKDGKALEIIESVTKYYDTDEVIIKIETISSVLNLEGEIKEKVKVIEDRITYDDTHADIVLKFNKGTYKKNQENEWFLIDQENSIDNEAISKYGLDLNTTKGKILSSENVLYVVDNGIETLYQFKALFDNAVSNVPFEVDITNIYQRSNMKYNELGQLVSYEDYILRNGEDLSGLWNSVLNANSYARYIDFNIQKTEYSIKDLEEKRAIAESYGLASDVERISQDIDFLKKSKVKLEGLLDLANKTKDDISGLFESAQLGIDLEELVDAQAKIYEGLWEMVGISKDYLNHVQLNAGNMIIVAESLDAYIGEIELISEGLKERYEAAQAAYDIALVEGVPDSEDVKISELKREADDAKAASEKMDEMLNLLREVKSSTEDFIESKGMSEIAALQAMRGFNVAFQAFNEATEDYLALLRRKSGGVDVSISSTKGLYQILSDDETISDDVLLSLTNLIEKMEEERIDLDDAVNEVKFINVELNKLAENVTSRIAGAKEIEDLVMDLADFIPLGASSEDKVIRYDTRYNDEGQVVGYEEEVIKLGIASENAIKALHLTELFSEELERRYMGAIAQNDMETMKIYNELMLLTKEALSRFNDLQNAFIDGVTEEEIDSIANIAIDVANAIGDRLDEFNEDISEKAKELRLAAELSKTSYEQLNSLKSEANTQAGELEGLATAANKSGWANGDELTVLAKEARDRARRIENLADIAKENSDKLSSMAKSEERMAATVLELEIPIKEIIGAVPFSIKSSVFKELSDAKFNSFGQIVGSTESTIKEGISVQQVLKIENLAKDISRQIYDMLTGPTPTPETQLHLQEMRKEVISIEEKARELAEALEAGSSSLALNKEVQEISKRLSNSIRDLLKAKEEEKDQEYDERQEGYSGSYDIEHAANLLDELIDQTIEWGNMLDQGDLETASVIKINAASKALEALDALNFLNQYHKGKREFTEKQEEVFSFITDSLGFGEIEVEGITNETPLETIGDYTKDHLAQNIYRDAFNRLGDMVSTLDTGFSDIRHLSDSIEELSDSMPKALNAKEETTKTDMVYNEFNQVLGYEYTTVPAEGEGVYGYQTDIYYDRLGQVAVNRIFETGKYGSTVGSKLSQYSYDDFGRIKTNQTISYGSNNIKASLSSETFLYNNPGFIKGQVVKEAFLEENGIEQSTLTFTKTMILSTDTTGNVRSQRMYEYFVQTVSEPIPEKRFTEQAVSSKYISLSMAYDHMSRLINEDKLNFDKNRTLVSEQLTFNEFNPKGNIKRNKVKTFDENLFYTDFKKEMYSYNMKTNEMIKTVTWFYDRYGNLISVETNTLGPQPISGLGSIIEPLESPLIFATYDLKGETSGVEEVLSKAGRVTGKRVYSNTEYDSYGRVTRQTVDSYDIKGNLEIRQVISTRYGRLGRIKQQDVQSFDEDLEFDMTLTVKSFYDDEMPLIQNITRKTKIILPPFKKGGQIYRQSIEKYDIEGALIERRIKGFGVYPIAEISNKIWTEELNLGAPPLGPPQEGPTEEFLTTYEGSSEEDFLTSYSVPSYDSDGNIIGVDYYRIYSFDPVTNEPDSYKVTHYDSSGDEIGSEKVEIDSYDPVTNQATSYTTTHYDSSGDEIGSEKVEVHSYDPVTNQATSYTTTHYDSNGDEAGSDKVEVHSYDPVTNKAASYTTTHYDSNGDETGSDEVEVHSYDPVTNQATSYTTTHYDPSGNETGSEKTEIDSYDPVTNQAASYTTTHYDSNGDETGSDEVEVHSYDPVTNQAASYTTTHYDPNGNETGSETTEVLSYDANGRPETQRITTYAPDGTVLSIQDISYTYYEEGPYAGKAREQHVITYDPTDGVTVIEEHIITINAYDDQGNAIEQRITTYAPDGTVLGIQDITLTYYEEGPYIGMVHTKRVIAYDPTDGVTVVDDQFITINAYDQQGNVTEQRVVTYAPDGTVLSIQDITLTYYEEGPYIGMVHEQHVVSYDPIDGVTVIDNQIIETEEYYQGGEDHGKAHIQKVTTFDPTGTIIIDVQRIEIEDYYYGGEDHGKAHIQKVTTFDPTGTIIVDVQRIEIEDYYRDGENHGKAHIQKVTTFDPTGT